MPGISQAVAPVTQEELELYDKIDFDMEEYARDVGTDTLLHGCKVLARDLWCRGPVGGGPEARAEARVHPCACALTPCTPRAGRSRLRLGGWRSGGSRP